MTTVNVIMVILAATTLVALWHCVSVINRMSSRTHDGVRWAYILKATGHFVLLLAVFDFLHGDPMAWPWLLLMGVALANGGTAVLHAVTRRMCQCPDCPMRKYELMRIREAI